MCKCKLVNDDEVVEHIKDFRPVMNVIAMDRTHSVCGKLLSKKQLEELGLYDD